MAFTIDPRVAELLGHDEHLPAVHPERLMRPALMQRFGQPPAWQPDIEVERWYRAPDPVAASVLVPLVMRDQPSVLLTQRTSHLKKHAGQISFPGGRSEPTDPDAVATALREAREEVGLAPSRVEVVGTMPSYTTGTGFVVTPVVGLIEPGAQEAERLDLQADPCEVDEIFEVPLDVLLAPGSRQTHSREWQGRTRRYFVYPYRGYYIWGATAGMLSNLGEILQGG